MIDVIITSYKEPKSTLKAVELFLKQKVKEEMRVTVVDPFPEVETFLREHIKDKRFNFFLDPGEGKNYALNIIFQEMWSNNKNDLFIMTDGDVYVSENSVKEILNTFKDKKVGCVTGRPVCSDPPTQVYGYWAKVLYDAIHKVRMNLSSEKKFFQCSGYLFAIRKGIVKEMPLDVPEDAIIPYLVWKEGYSVAYADKAEVYVKYPNNWKDWVNQRVRTIKAHENIKKVAPDMPRTKSFWNEIKQGAFFAIQQPKNLKEFWWILELYFARLYIYWRSFIEMKSNKGFNPAWRETEISSTKPLD